MKTFIALMCLAVAFASAENGNSKITKAFKRALGDEEKEELKTTILAGLDLDEFVKAKPFDEDVVDWMLSPVTMDDCMGLLGVLNQTAQDIMNITDGFFFEFENAEFNEMEDVQMVLKKVYEDYIEPKELDLEGLKDYVNGMLLRAAVLAGTAIDRLGELNEVGCIDKDNRDMKGKELGCVSTKGKLLMQAIDVRQMITFAELFGDESEHLEFCDSVYALYDVENITAEDVAGALVELMECTMSNGYKIEYMMNPDAPGYDGEPKVPLLPVPRLIHLQSKMDVYEMMGYNCYKSFEFLEFLLGGDEEFSEEKKPEVRSLVHEARTKMAKRFSK